MTELASAKIVQAIYSCRKNLANYLTSGHEYYSVSNDIMKNIKSKIANAIPFHLHYKSACSKDLLN